MGAYRSGWLPIMASSWGPCRKHRRRPTPRSSGCSLRPLSGALGVSSKTNLPSGPGGRDMSGKRRAVTQVNIVAKRFEETLKFYRLLGLDIPEPMNQPPGALHAPANVNTGVAFEIDNEFLARLYNASWRTPSGGGRLLLTVSVGAREEVDEAYATLVAAGSQGRQSPYDAFWGSRFAIVVDPDGNDVGVMSPPEEPFKSWPPVESPSL